MWPTMVKVAMAPAGNVKTEHVVVVPVVHDIAGPLFCLKLTNVIPDWSVSVSVALLASCGPPFVSVMSNVTSVSAAADCVGPVLSTLRSACGGGGVLVAAEPLLFSSLGSVAVLAVATLVKNVPG